MIMTGPRKPRHRETDPDSVYPALSKDIKYSGANILADVLYSDLGRGATLMPTLTFSDSMLTSPLC